MKIVPVAEVKADLGVYLDVCATEGPVIITRDGKAVALLLAPLDDADLERLVLARSPRFQALLAQSRQSIQAGKGLSGTEFWEAVRQRNHRQTGPGVGSVDTAD